MARISMQRLALLLTASFATLLVALALTSPSASAAGFCGGQRVNNVQSCFGAPRMVYEYMSGYGDSSGVCIGYNEVIYAACSPNARAYEHAYHWITGYLYPRIIGQASYFTVAHGNTY